MVKYISDYLTTFDYEPELRPFGLLVYAPGGLETHIRVTEYPGFFHLQSITPLLELGDKDLDLDLVSRLAFRLSIHAGFTITLNRHESRLEALFSCSVPKVLPEEDPFEASKVSYFAIMNMIVNGRCILLQGPLSKTLLGDDSLNVAPEELSRSTRILESIGYRPSSPDVLVSIGTIQLELESLVTHMTGRFNYSQQPEDETTINSDAFSYSEFGESEGKSPLASFHATYEPGYDGAFVFHVGIVALNASAQTVEDIEDTVRAHFNDPSISLIGYYYVTKTFGACYVARLEAFIMEILQRGAEGLEELDEIRKFQLSYSAEAFRAYKLIEGVSRSMREPEPHPNAEFALELYREIYDLEYSADRRWSNSSLSPKWACSDKVMLVPSKNKIRICDVYLSDLAGVLGFAQIFVEFDEERCVLYMSITFPNDYLEFSSEVFPNGEDRFQLEFGKLANLLSKYDIRSFGDHKVLWSTPGFDLPGLDAVNSKLHGWLGLEEAPSAEEHVNAWFETWVEWDAASSIAKPEVGFARLWFDPNLSAGGRPFHLSG